MEYILTLLSFLSYSKAISNKAIRGTSSQRINSKSEQSMQTNAIFYR